MPLYIAQSGDLDRCYRCLTDWLTTLKDRATQLLKKYKSGALVTQLSEMKLKPRDLNAPLLPIEMALTSLTHFQRPLDSSALNACDITWAVLCGSKKLRPGFVLWALWPHIRSACLAMSRLAVLIHFSVTNVRSFRRCLSADGAKRLFLCCD